jgi:hypothetical protein
MFNTFTDAFTTDGNDMKKMNGTNPFDLPASTTDPFGISNNMKISESSEKFDDNPFNTNKTNNKSVRPRSGKEALSSSNWLAYQHSMDETNSDSIEDLQEASTITQTNNVNLNNPFLISTIPSTNEPADVTSQNFTIDFLSNSNTIPPINSKNPFGDFDQNPSSYDPFGLNQTNTSVILPTNVIESDSFTDISKLNQNQTFSSPSTIEKPITEAAWSHPIPAPLNTSGAQTTALPVITGVPSNSDQFLDWFTQPDNFMSGIDSKQNESSAKNDIHAIKSTTDLFANSYRTTQTLSTLRMCHKFFQKKFYELNSFFQKKILKKMFHHHRSFLLNNQ